MQKPLEEILQVLSEAPCSPLVLLALGTIEATSRMPSELCPPHRGDTERCQTQAGPGQEAGEGWRGSSPLLLDATPVVPCGGAMCHSRVPY